MITIITILDHRTVHSLLHCTNYCVLNFMTFYRYIYLREKLVLLEENDDENNKEAASFKINHSNQHCGSDSHHVFITVHA